MVLLCSVCEIERAVIKRPKNGQKACKECFFKCFEDEIHQTILKGKLFKRGDKVAIASSGGKDSTVLGYVLKLLNDRHDYGLDLILLSIDEGIIGYRDDSLKSVEKNQKDLDLPLVTFSYEQIYGWTMDRIVEQIGLKNNCTFCGVFRRQALNLGATLLECDKIVTGHNADDLAETILMNVLRGDIARLERSVNIQTGDNENFNENDDLKDNQIDYTKSSFQELMKNIKVLQKEKAILKQDVFKNRLNNLQRGKPFKYTYEKEIVMYAYFKKLDYFSTECIYAPNSYRGYARTFLKDLEVIRPSVIMDIIHSGENFQLKDSITLPKQGTCNRCGYISSQTICKACIMLEGLNKGRPKLGLIKSSKVNLIKKKCDQNTCSNEHCELNTNLIENLNINQLKKDVHKLVSCFKTDKD